MKLLSIVPLILLLSAVILTSGCVTRNDSSSGDSNSSTPALRPSGAEYITNFVLAADGDMLEARFSLTDALKNYVSGDGTGSVRIVSSDGKTVYTGSVTARAEDFETYTIALTHQQLLAYAWDIPLLAITKSTSASGKAYLKFRMADGVFDELETSVYGLPTYSQEDLDKMNEDAYAKTAATVDKTASMCGFTVTVRRTGPYAPLVLYGDKKTYFRVDLDAKNSASSKQYLMLSGMAVLDSQGGQYEMEYGGTLELIGEVYPGVTKSGYVLFKAVPSATSNVRLVFDLGRDEAYNYCAYDFEIPAGRNAPGSVPAGPDHVAAGDNVTVSYSGSFTNGSVFDSGEFTFTQGSGQVIPGFDAAVLGMTKGQQKTVTIPPADAYGEYDPSSVRDVPLAQERSRTEEMAADQFLQMFGVQPVVGNIVTTSSVEWPLQVVGMSGGNVTLQHNPAQGQTVQAAYGTITVTTTADTMVLRIIPIIGAVANGGTILSYDSTNMKIDYNHPLAGKTLVFTIRVVSILKAAG